jgi:hypothetical protein
MSREESRLDDGSVNPKKFLWFTYAFVADSFDARPRRDGQETFGWIKMPSDGILEGDIYNNIYTDGSLMDNDPAAMG